MPAPSWARFRSRVRDQVSHVYPSTSEAGAQGRAPARGLAGPRLPCYTRSVANLTITVDEETLKAARIRALEQGTSVNAVLAEYLRVFAGNRQAQAQALESLLDLARQNARTGRARAKRRGRRRWTREELHERR
jgi:hypothetical protein